MGEQGVGIKDNGVDESGLMKSFGVKEGYSTKVEVPRYNRLHNQPREELFGKLDELMDNQFYGSFEITFENGVIQRCKKTESIKL